MATIPGSAFPDFITGTSFGDFIHAGGGADTVRGGSGNDTIFGDEGNDNITGGSGNDTFVFQGGGGSDVVLDFEVDHDIVKVQQGINGLPVNSAADIADLVSDDGGNAVIDFGNGDTLTLVGVSAEDVQADPSKYFLVQ